MLALEHLLQGQEKELRSPPMLIVWPEHDLVSKLEEKILNCTSKPVQALKSPALLLKTGCICIVDHNLFENLVSKFTFNQISLQVLDAKVPELAVLKQLSQMQILIDESLSVSATAFEKKHGLIVNDVLPALSFSSEPVELFANMRKQIA